MGAITLSVSLLGPASCRARRQPAASRSYLGSPREAANIYANPSYGFEMGLPRDWGCGVILGRGRDKPR
jgi:hypothetical protein